MSRRRIKRLVCVTLTWHAGDRYGSFDIHPRATSVRLEKKRLLRFICPDRVIRNNVFEFVRPNR